MPKTEECFECGATMTDGRWFTCPDCAEVFCRDCLAAHDCESVDDDDDAEEADDALTDA